MKLIWIIIFSFKLFAYEIAIDSSVSKATKLFIEYEILEYEKPYVVLDNLMWQDNREAETLMLDWDDATRYCSNLKLLGHSDWYLPDKYELKALIDESQTRGIHKEFKYCAPRYWSSSPYYEGEAVSVGFSGMFPFSHHKWHERNVRCVRKLK